MMDLTIFKIVFAVVMLIVVFVYLVLRDRNERRRRRRLMPPSQPPAQKTPPGTQLDFNQLQPGKWGSPASDLSKSVSTTGPAPSGPLPQPRAQSLDLDPGQFAPQTDEQTRAAAQSAGNLWANAWFGRRDLIPPASDPRTIIIDRAMVGHGLLTPEELVEIHKVGEEMSLLKPDLHGADAVGDRAVLADRAERARRKEQKKTEAAERKRLHAESVTRRRQTDIIYLGRGVSRGLADRRGNVEKLRTAGLPVLLTPMDVATALGLTIPRLRWLAFHSDASPRSHYIRFTVPKRSGGTRALFAPHKQLAGVQEWIFTNILGKAPTHPAAHGFVAGRSTVSNATPHVGKDVLVNADLTDFFPSVTFGRVRGVFQLLGYSPAVATILALLCTESPRRQVEYAGKPYHVATGPRALPQGACTSPALSNLVARRMDSRLNGIASKLGFTYTRYADDLSFSASGEPLKKIGYLLARVRHIAEDEGFAVNEKKTRVLRQSAAQNVTGIIVNRRLGVPRDEVRRLRAILHRAGKEGLAAQNSENHPHFEMWVEGMLAYISMVNPTQAAPLRTAFEALPRD